MFFFLIKNSQKWSIHTGNVLSADMSDIHRVYYISSDLIAEDFAQQEEPLFLTI